MLKKTFLLALCASYTCFAAPAQDWPNLERYKAANATVKPPSANEKRVVFMGDSITDAWPNRMPEFFADKPYFGRGISGQTSPQMLLRFRQDVIDLKPQVVVILAGTNDLAANTGPITPEQTLGNIMSMAELAKANGIRVVLASVLPAKAFGWRKEMGDVSQRVIALNKMIEAYAEKSGFVYLDYHKDLADKENGLSKEYQLDAVHPNKAGYEVMAPLAERAIAKALR